MPVFCVLSPVVNLQWFEAKIGKVFTSLLHILTFGPMKSFCKSCIVGYDLLYLPWAVSYTVGVYVWGKIQNVQASDQSEKQYGMPKLETSQYNFDIFVSKLKMYLFQKAFVTAM